MNSLKAFLTKPHPFNYKGNASLASGIIIFLLLFLLQPFGFSRLEVLPRLWRSLLFAGVTGFTLLASYTLLAKLMATTFKEGRWFVWKDLVLSAFNMLLIGIANCLVLYLLKLSSDDLFTLLMRVVPNTFYIGFVASVLLVFLEQSLYLTAEMKILEKLNEQLRQSSHSSPANSEIHFESETGIPELRLESQDILYLKSEGNYVDIFWCDSTGQMKKELLRNRLKNVSSKLPDTDFFQCHRSYIIGLRQIQKLQKGSRDYELRLRAVSGSIPVSRGKATELIALLQA